MSDVPTGNTYDKYATRNPIEKRLMDGFFDALLASLPLRTPRRILEVGLGEGEVAERVRERFPSSAFTGIDLPDDELAAAWRARGLPGAFADIAALPFPDRTFDLVLCIEVLEHVPDPAAGLRELRRVAAADLVMSVPREPIWRAANMARGKYLRDLGNTPGHVNHWSARAFAEFVRRELDVVEVHRPLPWTMVRARVGA